MTTTSFRGFSKSLPEFLSNLAKNNNRDWFEAGKAEYNQSVVEPALQFIAAMEPIVSAFPIPLKAEARLNGSFRRIHRDVRFSKDKTPYNPRVHIIFWSGNHPNRSPASHIVLGPDHFGVGAGQWGFEKSQLEHYRTCVMDSGKFQQLANAIEQAGEDNQNMDDPPLKRLPKGFEADGLQAILLRHKGVVVRNHNESYSSEIFTDDCLQYVENRLRASIALNLWLAENTG